MKRHLSLKFKWLICLSLSMIMLSLSGCAVIVGIGAYNLMEGFWVLREKIHYQNKENFVTDTAQVTAMFNYPDKIVFWLSELEPSDDYHDPNFVVRGKNAEILRENGLYNKVSKGDLIEYVYAPAILGDGYIRPIVAIKTMDGEEILGFEEGHKNLLDSYK